MTDNISKVSISNLQSIKLILWEIAGSKKGELPKCHFNNPKCQNGTLENTLENCISGGLLIVKMSVINCFR